MDMFAHTAATHTILYSFAHLKYIKDWIFYPLEGSREPHHLSAFQVELQHLHFFLRKSILNTLMRSGSAFIVIVVMICVSN